MSGAAEARSNDIRTARQHFPATQSTTYLNTAAVGLASNKMLAAYRTFLDECATTGLDFTRAETAGDEARKVVAAVIGADAGDLALIPSVSAAAGLVAAQFGPAARGDNIVIGEREYSSNHFPWRMLAPKGYDVRQVPFRNGGVEPDEVARVVDGGTKLVAFSAVQSATGHRSDLPALGSLARAVGALVFVDGSQIVGARPIAEYLEHVDVLATPDHKFLMHPGRGLGYCYLSPAAQQRFIPVNAGWRAARKPLESFFGPAMDLSPTASRFDNSLAWVAAIGNVAALEAFTTYGADAIYTRNLELAELLRAELTGIGWAPVDLPAANRSTIVSIPIRDRDPAAVLAGLRERGIVGAARDGNLRLSVHFYNDEDDIARVTAALAEH